MDPKTKKIMLIVLGVIAAIAIVAGAYFIGRGSSDDEGKTSTSTTPTTETVTVAPEPEPEPGPAPEPAPSPSGPYSSMGQAVSYVEGKGMTVFDPGATWHDGNTLHVIHGTPSESASYGGDFFYFFVDGLQVAEESFTSAVSSYTVDSTTFSVSFNVYLPSDPHCCPTGGQSTVQFNWDGGSLVTIGSMDGASM
jgi:hypothetical protein